MKKPYHGSCHCGAVRFECELDLAEGTSKCNCSICTKTRFWKAIARADAFRLLQGEDALEDYQFGGNALTTTSAGAVASNPSVAGRWRHSAASSMPSTSPALDDATDEELAQAPVIHEDGRNDRWERAPAETRYL